MAQDCHTSVETQAFDNKLGGKQRLLANRTMLFSQFRNGLYYMKSELHPSCEIILMHLMNLGMSLNEDYVMKYYKLFECCD